MTQNERPRRPLPSLIVGLVGIWLLAGAYFKLFEGSPAALPEPVRTFADSIGLGLGWTYKIIIAIELCVGFLALLWPRVAWPLLAGALGTFVFILSTMLGEESCGCFGPDFPVAPIVMLGIDGALLALLLATRPWKPMRRSAPGPILLVVAMAIGVGLPWVLDKDVTGGTLVVDGKPVEGGYVELDIENWVGEFIWDTPLGDLVDMESMFPEGLWVVYRSTCDHCALHLQELASSEFGERFITLIRLREPHDNEGNRVVHVKPEGEFVQEVELPDSVTYLITTPGDLELEGGKIVRAEEGAGAHAEH